MVGERRKSKGSPDMEGSSQLVPVSPRRHHHDYGLPALSQHQQKPQLFLDLLIFP